MTAKPGLNGFGVRLMEILAQANREARDGGSGRRGIAARLGVSEHTFAAWFKPSRTSIIPADRLFELACREDLLPGPTRDALWARLGQEGGYIIVPEPVPEANGLSPLAHLAELTAAVGRVAASLRESDGNGRPLKPSQIPPASISAMIGQLQDVSRHATQMRLGLEDGSQKKTGNRPAR